MNRFKTYLNDQRNKEKEETFTPSDNTDSSDDGESTLAKSIPIEEHNIDEEGFLESSDGLVVEETALTPKPKKSFQASLSGKLKEARAEKEKEMTLITNTLKDAKIVRDTAGGVKKEGGCISMWVPGFDARFPQMNQTRRCWQSYVDYFRCTNRYGDDERCVYFQRVYKAICPGFWIENWDDMREEGTFPSSLD